MTEARKAKYLYECDPLKNANCQGKMSCIQLGGDYCFLTHEPEYRLKGGKRINGRRLHKEYEQRKYDEMKKSARKRYARTKKTLQIRIDKILPLFEQGLT